MELQMIIVDSLCQKRKANAPLRVNGEEGFVELLWHLLGCAYW
jgi:hypothetical protein